MTGAVRVPSHAMSLNRQTFGTSDVTSDVKRVVTRVVNNGIRIIPCDHPDLRALAGRLAGREFSKNISK